MGAAADTARDLDEVELHRLAVGVGKRCTQSRSVWRSMPPIRAASARLIPSSTAASDSRRRLWLACLEAAASRRSSSVEKSALTVTAVAMARILPRHGIGFNIEREIASK